MERMEQEQISGIGQFMRDLNDFLLSFSPESTAILTAVIAIILSEGITGQEVNNLGSFISAVGFNLQHIGTQRMLMEAREAEGLADI